MLIGRHPGISWLSRLWTIRLGCDSMNARPETSGGRGGGMSRAGQLLGVLALAVLFVGCAGVASEHPNDQVMATPTAACAEVEGAEQPAGCAPYDPDHAMAQNERYRERMELSEESREAAEQTIAPIHTELEERRADGALSIQTVEKVLTDAGLTDVRVRDDYADLLFGAAAPAGGCVFGEVSDDALIVEAGGYILDGGCLPAQ